MSLTADEEKQLESLLRKKYGGEHAASQLPDAKGMPMADPSEASAKVHGDKLEIEPEK